MIVTDTSLLAHLFLGGPGTVLAREVFIRDPEWAAPFLWRSEFRSVLAQYLRKREVSLADSRPVAYIETIFVSYLTLGPSRDPVVAAHQEVTREWWDERSAGASPPSTMASRA